MAKKEPEVKPAAAPAGAPAKGAGGKGGDAPAKPAAGKPGDAAAKPAAGKPGDAAAAPAKPAAAKPAAKGGKAAPAAPAKKVKKKAPPKKLYTVQGSKLQRAKTECPKCGTGFFMAVHYNRRTCGKCSFTQFTDKDGHVRMAGGPQMGGPAGAMRQSRRLGRQSQGGAPGPADGEE